MTHADEIRMGIAAEKTAERPGAKYPSAARRVDHEISPPGGNVYPMRKRRRRPENSNGKHDTGPVAGELAAELLRDGTVLRQFTGDHRPCWKYTASGAVTWRSR